MPLAARIVVTFLVGAAVFILLPLIGWGVADAGGFFSSPARLAYVVLVACLNAFASIRIPEVGKPRREGTGTIARQHAALVLLQVLSISAVVATPYCDRRGLLTFGEADSVRYAGLVLYVCGFLLMHFAEAGLGRQFSTEVELQADHRLITTGVYRRIRHPRYAGIFLFMTGISLVFRSLLGLVLVALTAAVLSWRIRDEEQFMSREFGAEWEAYRARTRRVVPFLF